MKEARWINYNYKKYRTEEAHLKKILYSANKLNKGEATLKRHVYNYPNGKKREMATVIFHRKTRKERVYGFHHPLSIEPYLKKLDL